MQTKANGQILSNALVDRIERRLTRPPRKDPSTRVMGAALEVFRQPGSTSGQNALGALVVAVIVFVVGFVMAVAEAAIDLVRCCVSAHGKKRQRKRRKRAAVWHEYTV
jgi:hypothetical protein